jgi:hypothetical protein
MRELMHLKEPGSLMVIKHLTLSSLGAATVGKTTVSIMAFSIMTFSVVGLKLATDLV